VPVYTTYNKLYSIIHSKTFHTCRKEIFAVNFAGNFFAQAQHKKICRQLFTNFASKKHHCFETQNCHFERMHKSRLLLLVLKQPKINANQLCISKHTIKLGCLGKVKKSFANDFRGLQNGHFRRYMCIEREYRQQKKDAKQLQKNQLEQMEHLKDKHSLMDEWNESRKDNIEKNPEDKIMIRMLKKVVKRMERLDALTAYFSWFAILVFLLIVVGTTFIIAIFLWLASNLEIDGN
jgi:hypothetical protein